MKHLEFRDSALFLARSLRNNFEVVYFETFKDVEVLLTSPDWDCCAVGLKFNPETQESTLELFENNEDILVQPFQTTCQVEEADRVASQLVEIINKRVG